MPDYLDNAVRSFPGWQLSGYPDTQRAAIPGSMDKGAKVQGSSSNDQKDEDPQGFGFFFAGTPERPYLRPFKAVHPDLSPISSKG
jgi:hypothetical protein